MVGIPENEVEISQDENSKPNKLFTLDNALKLIVIAIILYVAYKYFTASSGDGKTSE